MYIDGMRILGRILSLVTAVALRAAGGPALYCAQASMHSMPCCRTSARCDLGMKAAACCTVEPSSAFPGKTIAGQTTSGSSLSGKRPLAAAPESEASAGAVRPVARDGRLWYPPPHDGSPALYLRNASILR